jgi:hypothetical protein
MKTLRLMNKIECLVRRHEKRQLLLTVSVNLFNVTQWKPRMASSS